MYRPLLTILGIGLALAPAQAAYHTLECVDYGELSTGESFLQLRLTVALADGEHWQSAECEVIYGGGEPLTMYQSPFNDTNPPVPLLFQIYPDSPYTSFFTAPHLWPNTDAAGSVMLINESQDYNGMSASWFAPSPVSGPGEFVIAQFTLMGGPGDYNVYVKSVIDPAPTVSGLAGFCTCHVPCGIIGPADIDFGPWTPATTSTIARIPPSPFVTWETGAILGDHAADFSLEASSFPADLYAVAFTPTSYGFREATLKLEGTYTDPFDPNAPELPYELNIPLTGYGLCYGDFDGDAHVGLSDLAHLLAHYGQAGWGLDYFDGNLAEEDGYEHVDLADLAELLSLYGTTCE